jgi:hypothetical protein
MNNVGQSFMYVEIPYEMSMVWAAGAAVLLVLTSAGRLFARVAMVETSFGESPNGQISAQDRTV